MEDQTKSKSKEKCDKCCTEEEKAEKLLNIQNRKMEDEVNEIKNGTKS